MSRQVVREQLLRFAALFRLRRAERDMADELEFHLAMKQQKYMRERGLAGPHALNEAKRDLGGLEKWKEVCRDVGRARPLEDFARDIALASRMLRKTPAFTVVALLTLTLAIGANTAIFSLLNAIMLGPLAVPEADRLAILRVQPDDFGYAFSYPLFKQFEKQTNVFSHVFGFVGRNFQIHGSTGTERVAGQLVSGQYFTALKVNPVLGRYITPSDDRPGTPSGPVAVISERFWKQWFAADRNVLGRRIVLNNVALTVIGVMPKAFKGVNMDEAPDVFLPLEAEPLVDAPYSNIAAGSSAWWFFAGARLRDGVSLARASAFLRAASHAALKATASEPGTRRERYLIAEPGVAGYSYLRLRFEKPLIALMALVALVLLISCLNLATLLMVRAASRERELATRLALGASRARLLRQLLTESMLLAATGTILGLAAAPFLAKLLSMFLRSPQEALRPPLDVAPDLRVVLFTVVVAVVVTLLTGMAPALRSTGRELQQRMRQGSVAIKGAERRHHWPHLILACEVALALVLVTGAGMLGYSLVRLHEVPIGFEPKGLVLLVLEVEKQARDGKALVQAYRDISDRLAALPGVEQVGYVNMLPLMGSWWTGDVAVVGHEQHELFRNQVGPGYFHAMSTPLLAGREFRWNDNDEATRVAILNQAAARVLFPNGNPLGQRLAVDDEKTIAEVVGVVGDAKYQNMRDVAPPTVYSSFAQGVKNKPSYAAVIRVTASPASVISAARAVVRRVMPEIPPPVAMTMDQTIAEHLVTERMMATLALFFAGAALLITAIGLYGTLAYTTARRTGEIGIRFALGAQRGDVIGMVCWENGIVALGGCGLGLSASLGASKFIASFLFSTSPKDPLILASSVVLLIAIATAASLIPAVRAARIDPLTAIRYE